MSAAATHGERFEPDFRPGIRILARLARVAEQACQETGISLPQYRLLVSTSEGPRRASELAARVGVSRPTLTSLAAGLERSGLMRRLPVESDRRGIELTPTDAGRAAVARAETALTRRLLHLVDPRMAKFVSRVVAELGSALDREGEEQRAAGRSGGAARA